MLVLPILRNRWMYDLDSHPIDLSDLSQCSSSRLKDICCYTINFVDDSRDFASIFENMVMRNILITLNRIIMIMKGRTGGLTFFGLSGRHLLFIERAQQQLLVQSPQQQIVVQQQQPDVVIRRQLASPPLPAIMPPVVSQLDMLQIGTDPFKEHDAKLRAEYDEATRKHEQQEAEAKTQLNTMNRKSEEDEAKARDEYNAMKRKRDEQDARARDEFNAIKWKQEEDEARVKAEFEAVKRKREEDEARTKAEYDAIKRQREQTEARTKAEFENIKRQQELNEAKKRAEFEATKRQRELDEVRKRAEFDAAKRRQELDEAKARAGYGVPIPLVEDKAFQQPTYDAKETETQRWEEYKRKRGQEEEEFRRKYEAQSQSQLQPLTHTEHPSQYPSQVQPHHDSLQYPQYPSQYQPLYNAPKPSNPPSQAQNHHQTPPPPSVTASRVPHTAPDSDSNSNSSEETKFDPYEALGLRDRDRTPTDLIQTTFTKLAMLNHPDKQVGKPTEQQKRAAKRMCEINQAKGILCDEARRRAYDEVGAVFQFEYEAWKKSNGQPGLGAKGSVGKYYPSY